MVDSDRSELTAKTSSDTKASETKPPTSKATGTKVADTKSTVLTTDSKPSNVKGNEKPSPSATSHQKKRKSSDFIERTTVVGPDDSKRTRKGPHQGPANSHGGHTLQKAASSWSLQGNPVTIATFENGMRVTPGRGMMNQDYVGMILPLLDDFGAAGHGPFTAPWLHNGTWFYNECTDGTSRLVNRSRLVDTSNHNISHH